MKIYDKLEFKTGNSLRDGTQDYLGVELGMAFDYNVYKVFRSSEDIKSLKDQMLGLAVTDQHVDDFSASIKSPIGRVISTKIKECKDNDTLSTIMLQNVIVMDDGIKDKCLSLGYNSTLVKVEDKEYDFINTNLIAHHLAVVDKGRGGTKIKIIDKDNTMLTKIKDEDMKKKEGEDDKKEDKKGKDEKLEERFKKNEDAIKDISDAVAKIGEVIGKEKDKEKDKKKEGEDDKKEVKDKQISDANIKLKILDEATKLASKLAGARVIVLDKASKFIDLDKKSDNILDKAIMRDKSDQDIMLAVLDYARPNHNFTSDQEIGIAFKMLEIPKQKSIIDMKNLDHSSEIDDINKLKTKEI